MVKSEAHYRAITILIRTLPRSRQIMASADSMEPTPSRHVLLWQTVHADRGPLRGRSFVLSTDLQETLRDWARERDIAFDDWREGWEELMVLLALWEFKLPQDDPLGAELLPLVNMTKDEIRERTDEWDPAPTKASLVEMYIKLQLVRRHEAARQLAPQQPGQEHSPQQTEHLPDADGQEWFAMTVAELRRAVTQRRIPWVQDDWRMGWRVPLLACLVIADAAADGGLQHDPAVYRMLLPEVLGVVVMRRWDMVTCARKRGIQGSLPPQEEHLAKLIVRDIGAKASLLRPITPPPTPIEVPKDTHTPAKPQPRVGSDKAQPGPQAGVRQKRTLPWKNQASAGQAKRKKA
ncbi:hypothetical protein VSDG_01041 [Cytospora chrysosperma]|uniref:Uncharacterized protein n=1 Tax=Cytospora chrysosperma TaxID=252740 RepID=A0A423WKK3_CYTCH|nr:hypothetical protein VSDG_01041 [Valsa sordida]